MLLEKYVKVVQNTRKQEYTSQTSQAIEAVHVAFAFSGNDADYDDFLKLHTKCMYVWYGRRYICL